MSTINELTTYIKTNGTEKEIENMNRIITTMDDNANLDSIVNHLITIIKKLYRITLNIEERLKN